MGSIQVLFPFISPIGIYEEKSPVFLTSCPFIGSPLISHATYVFKNGKLIKAEEVATLSVQEHYSAAMEAYQNQNWDELIHQSLIVIKNFESTPFALDGYYFLGVGYFHTEELEYANRFLTTYLKKQAAPKYFEEAIEYKF